MIHTGDNEYFCGTRYCYGGLQDIGLLKRWTWPVPPIHEAATAQCLHSLAVSAKHGVPGRLRGQRFRCILGLSKNEPQDSNFHVEKGDQASSVGVRMLPLPPVSTSQLVILDVWLTW